MTWTLVQSDSSSSFDPDFNTTPTAGNLLLAIGGDRSGQDTSGTITGWTQLDTINHKPADATFRMGATVWAKISEGNETTAIDFPANVDYRWIGEFAPGAGDDPADLINALVDSAAISDAGGVGNPISSITSPALAPASNTYLKLGVCAIKKTATTHGPISYDEGLTAAALVEFSGSNDITIGIGLHTDIESTSQDLTATLTTATDRGLMIFYILIPAEAGGDQDLNVPFFQQTNSIFPLTVQNQSPLELEVPFHGSEAQLFAPAVVNQSPLELNIPHLASSTQIFAPTLTSGDKQLDIPFFQSTNSFFAPSVVNQSPQSISPGFIASAEQLFAPSLLSQADSELNVSFFQNVALLFTPTVFNEGEELFEPTLVGNGTLADRIMAGLIDQGFLTGTIVDREYARLLAKLSLTAPQPKSLDDLYSMAGEENRILGIGVDELTPA